MKGFPYVFSDGTKRELEDDYEEGGGGRKRRRGEGNRVDLRILLQSKVKFVLVQHLSFTYIFLSLQTFLFTT